MDMSKVVNKVKLSNNVTAQQIAVPAKKGKPMTDKTDTAALVAKFKAQSATKQLPGNKGTVSAKTEEAANVLVKAIADKDKPVEVIPEIELPPVEPKDFIGIHTTMHGLECLTIPMTMKDILDYTCYARDLYDVPVEKNEDGTDKIELSGSDRESMVAPDQSWQRKVNFNRASNQIKPYLKNELHFFPPLICIISGITDEVSVEGNTIRLVESGLAALDGQHRRAGIASLVAEVGVDSDFAKESMPIVVILGDLSLEQRQQIFADVNRMAKIVPKSINILFDHRDEYSVIAQAAAGELGTLVTLDKTSPAAKSYNAVSLSNVYNTIVNFASTKIKGHNVAREAVKIEMGNGDMVTDARTIKELTLAVIRSMPQIDQIDEGKLTYADLRKQFCCYSSTLSQAIGTTLQRRLVGVDKEHWVEVAIACMQGTNWDMANLAYSKFIHDGKVGTRADDVKAAVAALVEIWVLIGQEFNKKAEVLPTATA